jgi:hypothetical protein
LAESPFIANVAEFFTLKAAAKTVDSVGDAARKRIHEALLLGRQKATCAETLWANGHTAEGLALAAGALDATLAAVPALGAAKKASPAQHTKTAKTDEAKTDEAKTDEAKTDEAKTDESTTGEAKTDESTTGEAKTDESTTDESTTGEAKTDESTTGEAKTDESTTGEAEPVADWASVLEARGVSKADLEAIRTASSQSRNALPLLDRDVSPAHAELFVELVRARHRADRAIAPGAMTHADLRWTRVLRGLAAATAVACGIAGAYLGLRTPTGTFATASDFFQQSPQFAPEMAVDGSAATYWLLPDGATGWLEVTSSPPRRVERIRVLNTTNPPWADRGTNEYRLEVYAHGELARTIDGTFEWADTPRPVEHPIDLDGVERVRFVVRSHHRVGAGLAELSLE